MSKTDIYKSLIKAIESETEISEDKILSESRKTEVVDARSILVNLMHENGFYPSQIAQFIHKTPSTVHNLSKKGALYASLFLQKKSQNVFS